jgi:hypothetical protein
VASNATGRIWSPTNADESCAKYVPGVQEFSKVGIRRGAMVCGENRCEAMECPVIVTLRYANGPSTETAAREMVSEGDHSGTFAYADDIGLLTCSATDMQQSIDIWCKVLTNSECF